MNEDIKELIKNKLNDVIEKYCLFEVNNHNTRQCVVNQMEYFLDKNNIPDGIVICDETNNTDDIIDENGFVCEIIFNNGDGTFLTIKGSAESVNDIL